MADPGLTDQEYDVLKKRMGWKGERQHTLQEIGDIYNLSRERIRQIEAKAFRKLYKASEINKKGV